MFSLTPRRAFGLCLAAVAFVLTFVPSGLAQTADYSGAGSASARTLVTTPVDAAETVELAGSLPSFVAGAQDLGVLSSSTQISGVQLVLRRTAEQQHALQQIKKNGGVADLSPELFEETFGIARSDVQAVEAWLASNGLHVDAVNDGGRVLVISGEALNFESAFATELHNYASAEGTSFFANKSPLNVPAALQPVISKVTGLQTYHAQGALAMDGPVAARKGFQPELSQTQYPAANTTVGTTSATVTATLTYTASSGLSLATVKTISVLTQGVTGGDFAYVSGGTCTTGVIYFSGNTCTVKFNFTPKYPGQRLGAIELISSNGAVVAESFINGVGVSGQGEFTIGATTTVSSSLNLPRGVSVDYSGNVYVADSGSGNIYKYTNGTGTPLTLASGFTNPTATGVDGAGNVYIASQQNNEIYEIVNGVMATTTQTAVAVAAVTNPDDSMAIDGAGNVYFASCPSSANEPYCSSQLNVMAAGTHTLTTLIAAGASIPGISGATFGRIIGMSIDYSGNLYLADFTNNRIYKMAAGTTTLSVLVNQDGNLDNPHGIVVDGAGDMYVTNYDGNPYLLRYAPSGSGYVESTFSTAISSVGIAEDQTGNFYMLTGATSGTGALYKFTRATTPVLTFPSTQVGSSSAQQVVAFENDGNAPLTVTLLSATNANLNGAATTCTASTALAVGGTCNLGVEFAPTTISSSLSGSANITDNTLAATGTVQTIQISGPSYGLSSSIVNMSTNPTSVTYGQGTSVEYFAFVQGQPGQAQPTGTVTFTSSTFASSPQTGTIAAGNCSTTGSGATLVYSCGVAYTGNVPVATAAGTYTYTATYNGDTHYATSTNSSTVTVNGLDPSTAMVSAVATTYGSTTGVTVTATEAGSYGVVTGGVVTFSVTGPATGSFSPATCTLSSSGTCTTSFIPTGTLAAGTYASDIKASFAVNNNYNAATATSTLTVNKNTGATLGTLSFSPTTVAYGSSTAVTITDSLSYTGSGAAPTGAVTFVLNGVTYTATCTGSSSPLSCSATVPASTVAALAANNYTVTAALAADTNYSAATGTSGTFAVTAQTPALGTISVSPSSVQYGTSTAVTLSESVSYNGSSVPPGPMTFTLNGVNYTGTCTGTSSPLTCTATVPATTVKALAINGYTVTSSFAGTGNFATATGSGSFTVTQATATFGTMTISPTSVVYGSSTALTITDTLAYTSSVAPTGAVTFTTFGVAYTATCTGSSSPLTCVATVPASAVAVAAVNTYSFAPAYAGNSYYNSATGTAGTFNITAQTPSLGAITFSPSSVNYGSSTAVTISETVAYTGSNAPSGTMTFVLNGVTYTATCSGSSSPLTCSATVPAATVAGLAAKGYTVTSSYTAAGNFAAATGSGSFTVNDATATFGTMVISPTSVVYGSSTALTITDTLSYTSTVAPTGAVTFTSFGVAYTATCTGSSSPLTCVATVPASAVAVAAVNTYSFAPAYAGNANYNSATGTSGTFNVTAATPTLGAISFSPSSVTYGSSTAVTISETVAYTGSAPTGTLTFVLNGVTYTATCSGSSSPLTCSATVPAATVAALAVKSYSVTSSYSASGNYGSATGSGTFNVTQATPTFGTVTFSPVSTVAYGTSQAITVSVPLNYSGTSVPTGAVTIYGDYQTYTMTCTGSSSPLTCSVTVPASTVHIANPGTYPFTPTLAADTNYATSTGSASNFIVTLGNLTFGSSTTFSPAASEAYGTSQAITVSNTLSYIGVANPSGYVYFNVNGTAYQATCTGSATPQTCTATIPAATVVGMNVGSYPGTWQDNGDGYYNATTVSQSNAFAITQAAESLALAASSYGTTTAGISSTTLTATSSPSRAGVTVTFTDATTGTVLGTAVSNSLGVATLAISTTTTGIAAGLNNFTASFPGTTNYTSAASSNQTVYVQGLLITTDLTHDFSTATGTYDGSPVCNGSNGTAGSTCTNAYGILVTNFTSSTQVVKETLTNSASKAFSYATNCPTGGLAPGKTCNVAFYYNPPYGDGCSLTSTCTTPAGQPGPEGTFEEATWSIGTSTSGVLLGIGDAAFDRSGPTAFPAVLDGKALLAPNNSLQVSPLSLNFGPQAPNTIPQTQNVTVTNTSGTAQAVTYSIPGAPFTTTNDCGPTLAAGVSCTIQVSYSSSTLGTTNANMTVTGSGTQAIVVAMTGTTANNGGISLTTSGHIFGNITDGTSASFGLGVTNQGSTPATLTFSNSGPSSYTVANSCANPLPAGQSCQVVVTFAPTTPGSATDALTVASNVVILPGGTGSNGSYTDTISFSGIGVAGGSLTATSTVHNFGTEPVGAEANSYGVELSNNTSSAVTLTLGGGTFASNGAADGYTMQTNCPVTLAVNQNCELMFLYTPTATGATQVFYPVAASNSSGSVPLTSGGSTYTGITLSGTGE